MFHFPCRLMLLLAVMLLAPGCRRGTDSTPAARPQAGKEGEAWTCDDLTHYLHERGIRLFQLGDVEAGRNGLPDVVFYVDDQTIAARKGKEVLAAALTSNRVGTVLVTRHPTVEEAKRQILPRDEGAALLWGRFVIVAAGPLPAEGETKESTKRVRSKRMVQAIKETLSP